MAKKIKQRCIICSSELHLFQVQFEFTHNYYCHDCLAEVLKEKPDTILSVFRVDNIYYDLTFLEKEVK